jgi:hypothetical protein
MTIRASDHQMEQTFRSTHLAPTVFISCIDEWYSVPRWTSVAAVIHAGSAVGNKDPSGNCFHHAFEALVSSRSSL